MEAITIATLASGPGAWFVTTGILIAIKERLGPYWNDLANRLTSFFLPIVLVEIGILATAAVSGDKIAWYLYIVGALNGILASTGVSTSQKGYDMKVAAKVDAKIAAEAAEQEHLAQMLHS